jgi:hypothetical protein
MRSLARGAAVMVMAAGGHAALYRLGQTWGASAQEQRQPLPGDELLADATAWTTHAITIGAPPAVWPWLVQMGWGRAGWSGTGCWCCGRPGTCRPPGVSAGWPWTGSGAGSCTTRPLDPPGSSSATACAPTSSWPAATCEAYRSGRSWQPRQAGHPGDAPGLRADAMTSPEPVASLHWRQAIGRSPLSQWAVGPCRPTAGGSILKVQEWLSASARR